MRWIGIFPDLSPVGVSLGRLGAKEIHSAGHGKEVFGLFPGLVRSEYPRGKTPQLGTFINQFMKVRGHFPVDFRPLGWVHSSNKSWWGRIAGFVLVELGALLPTGGVVPVSPGCTVWPPAKFP